MHIEEVNQSTEDIGPYRWKDFVALPDDDRRELVDGYLLETDVPNWIHEWIVATIVARLRDWAMSRRAGVVIASGYKVRVSDTRGVMPDVQFFRTGGRPIPNEALEHGCPDVAVEVISPTSGRFDGVKKLAWYASIGVPEYWLMNPVQQTLERFCLEGSEGYPEPHRAKGDALFEPGSLPGFQLSLSELWSLPDWFSGT